jgi:hypothetical protein
VADVAATSSTSVAAGSGQKSVAAYKALFKVIHHEAGTVRKPPNVYAASIFTLVCATSMFAVLCGTRMFAVLCATVLL